MRKRGGDSNNKYVSIIATHQARIRCLLSDILGKKIERFMNGAVLRLEFDNNGMSCTLVHQGELDPTEKKSDRKYYVTDTSVSVDHFIPEEFPKINNVDHTYKTDGNNYVFFLIRHGQGVHNTLKGMKKLRGDKDPELTDKGVTQAENTGKAMKNDTEFQEEFQEAKYLFSSDLKRTIQTLVNVVNQSDTIVSNVGGKQIVVLPCCHELNYDNKGSCDGSSKQMFTGNENKTSCRSITDCIQKYEGFNINWNFYSEFYGEGTRLNPGKKRNRCRNAKFLQKAIDIIKRSGEMFDANIEMYPRRDRAATIDNVDEKTGHRRIERSLTFGGKKRKTRKIKQLKRKRKTYKRKRKNKKRTRKRGKSIRKRKRTRSRK